MYKYKREINNYDQARQLEYSLTDNSKVCFCTTGSLQTKKPYHGMYIKDGKVLLENLIETFESGANTYKIIEIETKKEDLNSRDYITNIDLEKNLFEYELGDIAYSKRFAFEEEDATLCIEYVIKNNSGEDIKFNVTPLITYRDLYNMKNIGVLKFNQRDASNGTVIALSVSKQENIALKSDKMVWESDSEILKDVKHEIYPKLDEKEVVTEDLAICGKFKANVKAMSESKYYIYISYKDFEIKEVNSLDVFNNIAFRNKSITFGVDENFVELVDLSESILNTHMRNSMVECLPYSKAFNQEYIRHIPELTETQIQEDVESLINIVKAVEGQYLYYKKVKEAKITIINTYKIIKEFSKLELNEDIKERINVLKLWYIEAVNRVLQKEGRLELYIDSIKEILYYLIEDENKAKYFNSIEMTTLMINAIKVYLNVLTWFGDTDKKIEEEEQYFTNLIKNEFWVSEKNILKRNLNDTEHFANVEMVYALSLSFPAVQDDIPNKLLDTIFKELYTPYGLRKVSKYSSNYDGLIYPQYMAYFIKANLRLTGVTRASQKIAYNLVKELLQDVGKYVNGGTKGVYIEKGGIIDSMSYDVLTNAEMVRLYHMFM